MEIHESQNQPPAPQPGFFQSSTAKIIMVGLLTLVLLIPLQFVNTLIEERAERQKSVVNEINQKWGDSLYFYGPILKVPYTTHTETQITDEKTKKVTYQRTAITEYAYFFPEELNGDMSVDTEKKKRANYASVVYKAKMNFKGHYLRPDFGNEAVAENIRWDKATILIRTDSNRSINGIVSMSLGDQNYTFEPVTLTEGQYTMPALETPAFDLTGAFSEKMPFNLNINYNGSQKISVVPIGKMTGLKMSSDWNSPSFDGNFLPQDSTVTDSSFTANWKVSHINRAFGQKHFGSLPGFSEVTTCDVNFLLPVDQYQQNERASKYGFLVIGLTFLVFFLIQSVSKISIHLFQYSMIGLALIMFYTLLISITEHSTFTTAYIIAGVSVVAMIALYSRSILKSIKFPAFIAIALGALYVFIYVIIQLENYALLVGSIGLFLILGAVMYFSRKIEWR